MDTGPAGGYTLGRYSTGGAQERRSAHRLLSSTMNRMILESDGQEDYSEHTKFPYSRVLPLIATGS